ncbi:PIG-L deacetylase family protein [Oceanithermus desulfurans]|uniref:PIG-L family deacetylase n=2 Tax=Oceanithermus desulfurans TaxID=227924 RepID=A0A511RLZ0_9DEIN|nr:PIG-L family deacetylase [Oceanithermus desulfurans]MBB6030492.1 LmbE family N-acetylglucosaminyl deacetylase [Oceanithermus desulfurans]GEM90097.1 PIG-L family deacetylase [Oceanithermus desulfurans NBRC 100063]
MKRRLVAGLFLIALLLAAVVNAPSWLQYAYAWWGRAHVEGLPQAAAPGSGERVLVLAPHPDDEVLCCGGLLRRAQQAGAEVYIVWMTSGDGFEMDELVLDHGRRPRPEGLRALGERRMQEARAAAAQLGVPQQNLFFLGYPDRGLRHLFLENFYVPYRSPYTRLDAVAYPGTLNPGTPYTGEALERDLAAVFARVDPTRVYLPSPRDAHPDHQATSYFAQRVAGRSGRIGRLRYWIVHGGLEWPLPKGYHPGLALEPAPRGRGLAWRRFPLTAAEVQTKHAATLAHKSQLDVLSRFMLAFVRTNELFSPTPFPEPGRYPVP